MQPLCVFWECFNVSLFFVAFSELDLPYDAGSHGLADGCVVVGESDNRGTNSPGNLYWGAGADGIDRTMPATLYVFPII